MNKTDSRVDTDDAGKTGTGAVLGGVTGGVAGGAVTGMLAGGVTGPVGAAIGAAAGAVMGALAGKAKADPAAEDNYWRENYSSRPYVNSGSSYDEYAPAYRHGLEAHNRYPDRHFDDIESDLGRDWQSSRGQSSLEWDRAKHASRDAWTRVKDTAERAMPGDSDRDGK
ncbi:MAG TPA: hypothetical protein VEZ89_13015 [Rubrivivax sp.]|nr:hypothetical protein [Rubrivivax sp.]